MKILVKLLVNYIAPIIVEKIIKRIKEKYRTTNGQHDHYVEFVEASIKAVKDDVINDIKKS